LEIGKSIADNMAKNFDDLSTECLEIISNYLSSQFYSPAIAPKVIFLQDKVATEMKNVSIDIDIFSKIQFKKISYFFRRLKSLTLQPWPVWLM